MKKRWAAAMVCVGTAIGCGSSVSTTGGTTGTGTSATSTTTTAAATTGASTTAATTTSTTGAGGAASTTATTGAGGASTTTTTTGAGGGGGAGGAAQACNDCSSQKVFMANSQCAQDSEACGADAGCAVWLTCTKNCEEDDFTSSCFAACNQASMASMGLYEPLYTCVCSACKTECAPACS
jgi:hypothetical protein